jgi:hypothetical protein
MKKNRFESINFYVHDLYVELKDNENYYGVTFDTQNNACIYFSFQIHLYNKAMDEIFIEPCDWHKYGFDLDFMEWLTDEINDRLLENYYHTTDIEDEMEDWMDRAKESKYFNTWGFPGINNN